MCIRDRFIALPELLHRQNVALLRAEQIPSNAARFDGVAHHQCRNAGRICSCLLYTSDLRAAAFSRSGVALHRIYLTGLFVMYLLAALFEQKMCIRDSRMHGMIS